MNLLFKLSLMVIATLGVAIFAVGQFAPTPSSAFPFSLIHSSGDCQLPCWHDLRPGATTRDAAEAILARDPAFAQWFRSPRLLSAPYSPSTAVDGVVSVYFDGAGRVSVISFSLTAAPGDLLAGLAALSAQMGTLDCQTRLELYFPAIEADAANDLARARPHSLSAPIRLTLLLSTPATDPFMVLQPSTRLGLRRAFPPDRGVTVCGF